MATWVINDESCNLNFKQSGVSYRTLPKELIVLEIVLAGEPLNDTTVDNVFVRYEGKYVIELPYNDTTIGATSYASAELLRAAILVLLNSNPCVGGGGGGGGTLQTVTDSGDTTDNTMYVTGAAGAQPTSTVGNSQIRSGDNETQLESTLNSDGTIKATDNNNSTYTQINSDGSIWFAGKSGSTIGFSKLYFKKFHLTSSDIQNGNSTPIVLVPAQGAGTAIYAMHDTTARCVNGVVPMTAGRMDIKCTGASSLITWGTGFLNSATSNPILGDNTVAINSDNSIDQNKDLIAIFDTDNPAFDGTIDIYLKYEIITL